jgi:hypothetical protein
MDLPQFQPAQIAVRSAPTMPVVPEPHPVTDTFAALMRGTQRNWRDNGLLGLLGIHSTQRVITTPGSGAHIVTNADLAKRAAQIAGGAPLS